MTDTVLLTGVTGFIAKRIALDLLNAGYAVRGSLRSASRADEVRDAVRPHLTDPAALDRLGFVELDLTRDDGWSAATTGVTALIHTASPFPMSQPRNADEIVRPAVDGTLRALRAADAAGVRRVVLTSSVVAIEATDKTGSYTADDWTDPQHPRATAYYKSKTLAERAAWDFAAGRPDLELVTINPALVLGRPLDTHYGTSLRVVERLLSGRDPMVPDIGFGVVDVADVSAMHVRALTAEGAAGRRFIAAAGTLSMPEMARSLAERHPERRIATRVAPRPLLRVIGLFDKAVGSVLPALGHRPEFDATPAREVLAVDFADPETALARAADAVLAKAA